MVAASELPIDTSATALEMAETIFGEGVTVVSASYTGDNRSSGIYTDGDTVSPGVVPGDSGVILTTGRTSAFTNGSGDANQDTNTTTSSRGPNNDPDFNDLAGTNTYDASFLEVDIIPDGDVLTLRIVFASDEYPEYAGSIFNDIVGIWVDGVPAELAIGDGSTSVGNVNSGSNENLYIDNTGSAYNTEMDGFTVTLTVKIPVTAGEVNTIKIGIADVGDSSYDSAVLIAADSGQTALIAVDDEVEVYAGGSTTLDVTANDEGPSGAVMVVTHINGIAVTAGDTVILTTGQEVTLNPDGTLTIDADSDEEVVNFTYTVEDTVSGISDTAFVTINSVPCFVAGTLIATPSGRVPVEALRPGDLVETRDEGARPVRWIGRRAVPARGDFAPVHIDAGTLGRHDALKLSPLHRILIRDPLAELLFGEREVLVAAKELINGRSIRRVEGGEVEYVHILFDRHQLVSSAGLITESFLPGAQMADSFEAEVMAEIAALFPELDPRTGRGYPPAARRTLRGYEARLLLARGLAA